MKGEHHDEILQAIRGVAAGQAVFGPALTARLMNYIKRLNNAPQTESPVAAFPDLTERESEVLTLMAKGVSNKGIAKMLLGSMNTVSNHITNIFNKLQVADRAQAILRVRDAGRE